MTRHIPSIIFLAFAALLLATQPFQTNPPALAQDFPSLPAVESTPFYAQPEPNRDAQYARLDAITIVSALRGGILPGCPVIGGIEDGLVIAHCADTDTLIARGPEIGSQWRVYHGPVGDTLAGRMACLDGQTVPTHDCANDAVLRAWLVAGDIPVSSRPQP